MALESKLLTRLEPTIQLDKYKFKAFREEEGGSNVSRDKGMEFPLIIVNNYQFPREDIRSFEINVEDKIPTITVTVVDNRSQFAVETFPRDGDVMSIRIGSKSQETYKDIRIDFDIDNVESPLKNNVEIPKIYKCEGKITKREKHDIPKEKIVITKQQPNKEKEVKEPVKEYIPKKRVYTKGSNLPDDCKIKAEDIPKYCYYIKATKDKGDAFCCTKLHPKQKESGKDWTTTKSKKLSK